METVQKTFLVTFEKAPSWLSEINLGYVLRNYLKDGYYVKEVEEPFVAGPPDEDE